MTYGVPEHAYKRMHRDEKKLLKQNVRYSPAEGKWVRKDRRICPLCKAPFVPNKDGRCTYCGVFLTV